MAKSSLRRDLDPNDKRTADNMMRSLTQTLNSSQGDDKPLGLLSSRREFTIKKSNEASPPVKKQHLIYKSDEKTLESHRNFLATATDNKNNQMIFF